ncbi:transcriptional regulator [Prauserella sp. PE36]|uniref:GAF domain-containing protein n=1 Tax=Prauserella endophytica TaxID=1592324 RepID=A0ABY2S8J2_9PSEU|nr:MULTISPECIES: helix-turn-helix domain-containing protein [Prauserella]PXY30393.1 transcriptional regulator [Prauserella coralliicola]RBM21004.1 transcriptional regulator [Prauserella sp. PE36]TKG72218.1 GAF domain-containing protein [Prauserella endophytica]
MKAETVNTAGPATTLSLSADPPAQFALLQEVREATLSGSRPPASPRSVISESWQRSLAAHIDPEDYRPPVVYQPDELADVRSAHPLQAVLPPLRELLVSIADESQHVMIVTDAEGTILWREGPAGLCAQADPVGLCEGTRWAEESIGTNAMGTALALDAPVQIYSAEHLVRTYHTWTCAAAPIHDPDTGAVLGAIDISGLLDALHPATVSLVNATAQLAENHLRRRMELLDEQLLTRNMPHLARLRGEPGALLTPTGRVIAAERLGHWPKRVAVGHGSDRILLDDGREARLEPLPEGYLLRVKPPSTTRRPTLTLTFLGDNPVAVINGRELPLTLRRAEILALLALHPAGLTAEQLALQLYGDDGNPTTVRAEIHRLRTQLGAQAMRAKPYQLCADVDADFLTVRTALREGDVAAAAAACPAPLLARSDAPAIRAERDQLVAALRSAVLDHRDLDALWAFGQSETGQYDAEVFDRLARELPSGDPRASVALARLEWLLAED